MYSDNNKVHVVRKMKSMYMEDDDCCVYVGEHKNTCG